MRDGDAAFQFSTRAMASWWAPILARARMIRMEHQASSIRQVGEDVEDLLGARGNAVGGSSSPHPLLLASRSLVLAPARGERGSARQAYPSAQSDSLAASCKADWVYKLYVKCHSGGVGVCAVSRP